MTATLGSHPVNTQWTDITVAFPAAASGKVRILNQSYNRVFVVYGGASAPSGLSGEPLGELDSVTGEASNIWVYGGPAIVSVTSV